MNIHVYMLFLGAFYTIPLGGISNFNEIEIDSYKYEYIMNEHLNQRESIAQLCSNYINKPSSLEGLVFTINKFMADQDLLRRTQGRAVEILSCVFPGKVRVAENIDPRSENILLGSRYSDLEEFVIEDIHLSEENDTRLSLHFYRSADRYNNISYIMNLKIFSSKMFFSFPSIIRTFGYNINTESIPEFISVYDRPDKDNRSIWVEGDVFSTYSKELIQRNEENRQKYNAIDVWNIPEGVKITGSVQKDNINMKLQYVGYIRSPSVPNGIDAIPNLSLTISTSEINHVRYK